MVYVRTFAGAVIGAVINLVIFRLIPFAPDLTDWGGRAYPRSYILPLIIVAIVAWLSAWLAAKISKSTGRLTGMLSSLLTAVVVIGWDTGAKILEPLFHHPAYPVFSDHALLALAVLLVAGHLGGSRVERLAMTRETNVDSTQAAVKATE